MNYRISFVVFIFFIASGFLAITPEQVKLADDLKTRYPKFDVALNSVSQKVEFLYDGSEKQIYVLETSELKYIALNANAQYQSITTYNNSSEIEKVKVYNHKGSSKRTTPLYSSSQSDGIFHSDAKYCEVDLQFSEKGETQTVVFQKKIYDLKYCFKTNFQSDLPCEKKEVQYIIPEWLSLKFIPYNLEDFDIKVSSQTDSKGALITTYMANDIPNWPDDANSGGPSYYLPHVLFLPISTQKPTNEPLITSTAELFNWYNKLNDELNPDMAIIKAKVEEIIKPCKSDHEKINAIYNWVHNNIKYLAYEEGILGFKADEAQNVLEKKYGDCKGMANLLVVMLNSAGFDARMTWLGTNYLCYNYSTPFLGADNHCIATLYRDGKTVFLDATEKYLPWNSIAERIQGRQAMIKDGDSYKIEVIPIRPPDQNTRAQNASYHLEGTILTGTVNYAYDGEMRSALFNHLASLKTDDHKKEFEGILSYSDNNIAVDDLKYSELYRHEKPFELSATTNVANKITSFGNDYYISFDWEQLLKSATIKPDRKTDLHLNIKMVDKKDISFTIPENYKVTHLPNSISIDEPEYFISGKLMQTGQNIIYQFELTFKSPIITKNKFEQWNNSIKTLNEFYNDQIVLTKE
jgi:transglutaminase-like putative cysteine protease